MAITVSNITRGAADWDTTVNQNFKTLADAVNTIQGTMATTDNALIKQSTTIGGNTDWNTIQTQGIYNVSMPDGNAANTNGPKGNASSTTPGWGVCLVLNWYNSGVWQMFLSVPAQIYIRSLNGGGWAAWKEVGEN